VARLKGAKRQNNQLELAFGEAMTSEARSSSLEGTEHQWRSKLQKARLPMSSEWRGFASRHRAAIAMGRSHVPGADNNTVSFAPVDDAHVLSGD
jgi:hypothetical protein